MSPCLRGGWGTRSMKITKRPQHLGRWSSAAAVNPDGSWAMVWDMALSDGSLNT